MPERLRGEVELRDVGFAYAGAAAPALDGVSLRVAPGETVALVGRDGRGQVHAGQAARPVLRRGPGAVLVDGVDVRRYPLAELPAAARASCRRSRTCSPATSRPTSPTAGRTPRPAEIEAAARAVGALDLVRRLPGGFRHPVGERGQGLSAGQRQLVALARAELADPDLLLFDEATAALDPATEAAVLAAGDRVTARRTAFVVAHRLATAARADRVVVLDGGRIVEEGPHGELLAAGGHYARLWQAGELEPAVNGTDSDETISMSEPAHSISLILPDIGQEVGMIAGRAPSPCAPPAPRRPCRAPGPQHPARHGGGGPGAWPRSWAISPSSCRTTSGAGTRS